MNATEITGSILIPAHNEEAVVGRCLDALLDGLPPQVVVMVLCNGCSDRTAQIARSRGGRVQVIELPQPSKTHAIRAAEAAKPPFPRLYLDADVVLSGKCAAHVLADLREGALAGRPPIKYVLEGSSWPVRRYYQARSRVPSLMTALWGAGVYGLSEQARSRFEEYPEVIGEDLWIDNQFRRDEIRIIDCDPVQVRVPRNSRDLLRILKRAQTGKAEGSARRSMDSTASTTRGLAGALTPLSAQSILDVAVYSTLALAARVAARLPSKTRWERDESSRTG